MKNNANSLAIGMFVLGAALIAVAGVIIFGAAKFFEDDKLFASRFSETVNGLDVGAPVKFRGVKIGKVERIAITSPKAAWDKKTDKEDMVLVIYSIDLNLLKRRMRDNDNVSGEEWIRMRVKDGLRAKLNYQSIVTGMLYVELDYLEKQNPELELRESHGVLVIPSEPSGLSELMKSMQDSIASISRIDFVSLFNNANELIVNLNKKVTEIDAKNLTDTAVLTMRSADAFLRNADSLASSAKVTSGNVDATLDNVDSALASADKNLTFLSRDLSKTLAGIDRFVANIGSMTDENSQLRFELVSLLNTLRNSVKTLGNLADYIQRNPNAILTGKSLQR